MLLTPEGTPQPPSEIVRRLQQINPNLGLMWVPVQDALHGQWGVTMKWAPGDRRYAYIQRGEVAPDSDQDIVVFLPQDCGVDQAYAYFVSRVQVSSRDDVRAMVDRVQLWNRNQTDVNWKPVMDKAMEQVEGLAHGLVRAGSTAKARKRSRDS